MTVLDDKGTSCKGTSADDYKHTKRSIVGEIKCLLNVTWIANFARLN